MIKESQVPQTSEEPIIKEGGFYRVQIDNSVIPPNAFVLTCLGANDNGIPDHIQSGDNGLLSGVLLRTNKKVMSNPNNPIMQLSGNLPAAIWINEEFRIAAIDLTINMIYNELAPVLYYVTDAIDYAINEITGPTCDDAVFCTTGVVGATLVGTLKEFASMIAEAIRNGLTVEQISEYSYLFGTGTIATPLQTVITRYVYDKLYTNNRFGKYSKIGKDCDDNIEAIASEARYIISSFLKMFLDIAIPSLGATGYRLEMACVQIEIPDPEGENDRRKFAKMKS